MCYIDRVQTEPAGYLALLNERLFMARKNTSKRFTVKTFSQDERTQMTGKIRSYLRTLANRRNSGYVTADDVHTYLTREGVRDEQIKTRLSFINSVLREPAFEAMDSVPSSRPAARGRSITAWSAA